MSTDWKALCEELIALVERCPVTSDTDWIAERNELIVWFHSIRRAALAAEADGPAVPEGREPASVIWEPSDEELLELMPETMRDEFSYAAKACSDATGNQVRPGFFRVCLNTAALDYARAVLARFGGRPAPAPAEGEVAKLVRWLRSRAGIPASPDFPSVAAMLTRAADLLEQHHPAPVPVAERLPEPEDCDAEGLCWVWNRTAYTWGLFRLDLTAHSHWLPATALPQGEVEP